MAGSIAAVFSFLPLGIIAVIFTILAEPEFRAGLLVSASSDVNG